ncbi:hypothetical protein BXZ70DRAFT_1010541 [Cristinia sonorae]|uniref:Uncharacterized protein n=1 Tax=Cristinia sonorae TaxID=1940300 RepID=A0A8K0XMG9_9AGAR|nr:hypothetical protein BXZ70DRAFT_1010536 [Cristinia sonorae]KAH8093317.1 hypothetical protein BXZ70DRAFT_1010541 [Cristinia sonorae]
MDGSGDAFPNSETLFRQALSEADPVPSLLQLLDAHPGWRSMRDLVFAYFDEVEQNPSRAQKLASVLARLSESPASASQPIKEILCRELCDSHFKLPRDDEVKEYGPNNTWLLESLLSGMSLHYGLACCADQLGSIDDGLNPPIFGARDPELVMGTCIQILLGGHVLVSEMAGTYRKTAESIAKKLKKHKAAGAVTEPNALRVLELTITYAEAGLKPEHSRLDVWELLFPASA